MKSIISLRLLYLFLLFGLFWIPASTVYATVCTSGLNTAGNLALSGTCTIANTIDGPANGNITIANDSNITIGDGYTLTFPPGNYITIGTTQPTGITIFITKTGAKGKIIKTTNGLCLTDADADFYPASNAVSARTLGPCTETKVSIATLIATNATLTADANDAQACAAADTNLSGVTGSALVGTTCKKCTTGALANQTAAEDIWNDQCPISYTGCGSASFGGSGGCTKTGPSGFCDNAGACNATGGSANIPDGKVCSTSPSGGYAADVSPSATWYADVSNACTYGTCTGTRWNRACNGAGSPRSDNTYAYAVTVNAAAGESLSTSCTSGANGWAAGTTCKKCDGSGGNTTNQTSSQDLYGQCIPTARYAVRNSGSGKNCTTFCSERTCYTTGNCDGSGACATGGCNCYSVGLDASGTDTKAYGDNTCALYPGKDCSLVLSVVNGVFCASYQVKWTNCRCGAQ